MFGLYKMFLFFNQRALQDSKNKQTTDAEWYFRVQARCLKLVKIPDVSGVWWFLINEYMWRNESFSIKKRHNYQVRGQLQKRLRHCTSSLHPGTVLLGPRTVSALLGLQYVLTSDGRISFQHVPYFSHHTNPPARPLQCEEARPAVKVSSLHPEIASLD